ncbi:MAG: hypothetical protein J5449_06440 [Oscillospiraceae bacterium]|nr:hypothetical protein [Oscillospiraceae bacterium]
MKTRKPLSILLTLALVLGLLPWSVLPARADAPYDISRGPVIINSGNVSAWNGRTVTGSVNAIATAGAFSTVTADNQRGAIIVDGVSVSLTIRDLSVVAAVSEGNLAKVSPILLRNGARLDLTLEGANTLTACSGGAGIRVPAGCLLTVDGSGSLNATGGDDGVSKHEQRGGGAGIGTDDTASSNDNRVENGTIVINGGTITARGGSQTKTISGVTLSLGSAGIGGSANTVGGSVTINGGAVTATGGGGAAGIGGGFEGSAAVTITGGAVTATAGGGYSGGDMGAAIGCGY